MSLAARQMYMCMALSHSHVSQTFGVWVFKICCNIVAESLDAGHLLTPVFIIQVCVMAEWPLLVSVLMNGA